MKKYLLSAIIFCTFSIKAYSEDAGKKSYVGIGYQLSNLDYNKNTIQLSNASFKYKGEDYFGNNFANVNFFAGYKVFEDKDLDGSVDLEVGYFFKNNVTKNNNSTGTAWNSSGNPVTTRSESNLSVVSLDAIFNHNFNEYFKILTIGGVSGVFYKNNIDFLDHGITRISDQDKQNGLGFNAGVGSEVKIIKDISARATIKYTAVSGIDAFNRFITYGVGIKYNF